MRRLAFLISAIVILTYGVKAGAAVNTAILSAESSGTVPTAELLATGLFDSIDWFDVSMFGGSTPTLAAIEGYDSLLVYSNVPFVNRDALSGVLKDYVDGGGHVVLAAYSFTDINYLDYAIGEAGSTDGILTADYAPLKPVVNAYTDPTDGNLHALSPSDSIFDNISIDTDGLLSDFGYFHNTNFTNPILDSGAELLADDGDGTYMIARNTAGNVVALNLCPSLNGDNSGQFYTLVGNALMKPVPELCGHERHRFRRCPPVGNAPKPVPEPATSIVWVLLGFGLMVAIRNRT